MPCTFLRLALVSVTAITLTSRAMAGQICELRSPQHRLGLLELYTSEGCNSCPPADRWLSRLRTQYNAQQVVPLAFHVDYWNQLGWPDRFSHPLYTQRQQQASQRNRAEFVYTPQFLLDGKDVRPLRSADSLTDLVGSLNKQTARVQIAAKVSLNDAREVVVSGELRADRSVDGVEAYIVLYENGLLSKVTAGENHGKTLQHDYVVRALLGPIAPAQGQFNLSQRLQVPGDAKVAAMGVALFAQERQSGNVLQVASKDGCFAQ